jgi:hypothetical protein
MKQPHIYIIGVGALGSNAAMLLRNEDATFTLVDFDRVEAKNLTTQAFSTQTLGVNKAQAFVRSANFNFGRTRASYVAAPGKITSDNVKTTLHNPTLLVDATDNIEARRTLISFATANGVPLVHGALAPNGEMGVVRWSPQFVPDEAAAGAVTCETGEFLPLIMQSAASLALAVQTFLRSGQKTSSTILRSGVFGGG